MSEDELIDLASDRGLEFPEQWRELVRAAGFPRVTRGAARRALFRMMDERRQHIRDRVVNGLLLRDKTIC